MSYQIVNLTYANAEEIIIDDYNELITFVEKENYKSQRDGIVGAMLTIRRLSNGNIVDEKTIQLGYTEYTEDMLLEFDSATKQNRFPLFRYIKSLFKKIFSMRTLFRKKRGQDTMPPKGNWTYDGEPLEEPTQQDASPDEARAKIAAAITKQNETIQSTESIEIDYGKQYQEEQESVEKETVASQKKIEETPQPATPVLDTSTSDSHLPDTKPRTDLYDSATFSQEKLIQNMAKISDERSKIRQKILENQEIIERARRAEIENQSLEIEYQNQEQLLHKLQHFNNLFDEYREYLN